MLYPFNGQIIAQRSSDATGLIYLHGDHLGSASLATNASGAVVSRQEFDPWGTVRSGGIPQTTLNYTGQRRDGTGLLYYHARYYDPVLGRFISADAVVPGAPDGSMDGVALKPLTVDVHETGFVTELNAEHGQGFWFQNTDQIAPWGPPNPQGLNRYAYGLNNPVKYTDPTGHVAWWVVGGIGGAVVGLGVYALTHKGDFDWKHAALYAAGGAVVGATLGAGAQAAAGLIARAGAAGAAGTAGPTIHFLSNQLNRVNHIMQSKHNWNKLIQLSGDVQRDYQAIQPYLKQAMSTQGRQLGTTSQRYSILEFTATLRGQQVVVRAIEIAKNTLQITDA